MDFFQKNFFVFFSAFFSAIDEGGGVGTSGRGRGAARRRDARRLSRYNKKKLLELDIFGAISSNSIIYRGVKMKMQGNFKEWSVTQTKLAEILNLSVQRINQLIEEEVVLRDESSKNGAVLLIDSLRNYYLSKNAAGDNVNFWKEKGLHERAKRELAELKLRIQRGELYEASVVESVMIEHLTNFRTKLLGLPSKIAATLPKDIRGEVYDNLTKEIETCLEELATNYKNAELSSDVELETEFDE